jgi:hypothetical protein
MVDRELAVSRRQEELDVREATLQSRKDQLVQLEAGKEKLQRVYQHLTAREVSLNCREAVFTVMSVGTWHFSNARRVCFVAKLASTVMQIPFRELEQLETTLRQREAALTADLHKLQAKESQLHQQAQSQQTHLLALELPLQRRAAEVSDSRDSCARYRAPTASERSSTATASKRSAKISQRSRQGVAKTSHGD